MFPSGYAEAKEAERVLFKKWSSKKTSDEDEAQVRNLLQRSWSRDWHGSQPEGLLLGERSIPGWYSLVDQQTRDNLFQFVVQSVVEEIMNKGVLSLKEETSKEVLN